MLLKHYISNIDSYSLFEIEINKLIKTKDKGDLFEELTFFIFKFHPMYINFTRHIWLYNDIPINIKTKLDLPNKDMGIDLILESFDNKFYAIQCKYRKNRNIIVNWGELSTFFGLSFGINNCITGGFLVTDTYDLHDNVYKSNKIISIYGDFFDTWLDINFFNNVKNYFKQNIIPYQEIIPRPYQVNILNKTLNYFKIMNRGYLNMMCGSGKTLTSFWIDKEMNTTLTLILVPSLYLLSQFYKDWLNQKVYNYILVGSDADIGEVSYKNNAIILTDPNLIKSKVKGKTVIISTYQSSDKIIAIKDLIFDLCIYDEAHKTVGQIDKQFSLCLEDVNLKVRKRLFMTATPKIYNGDIDNLEDNILCMNNEKYYGKCITTYSARNAIDDKYLCDYQLVTINTEDEYIEDCINKNKTISADLNYKIKNTNSHYIAAAILLLNSLKNNMYHHMITYHNTIKNSLIFKQILESLAEKQKITITILQIDGSYSMSKRGQIIRDFINSEYVIMTSSKVLNEGINIPIIDSICFVDSKASTNDIIQCVGRALRLHPKKEKATIFIPTIFSNNTLNINIYENVIRVIKSMSQIDAQIQDIFKTTNNSENGALKIYSYSNNIILYKKIDIDIWTEKIGQEIWSKVDNVEYHKNKLINFSNPMTENIFLEYNTQITCLNNINKIEKNIGNKTLCKKIAKIIIEYYKKNDKSKQVIWNTGNPHYAFIIFDKKWKIDENNVIINNIIWEFFTIIIINICTLYNKTNNILPQYINIYLNKICKKEYILRKVRAYIQNSFYII